MFDYRMKVASRRILKKYHYACGEVLKQFEEISKLKFFSDKKVNLTNSEKLPRNSNKLLFIVWTIFERNVIEE